MTTHVKHRRFAGVSKRQPVSAPGASLTALLLLMWPTAMWGGTSGEQLPQRAPGLWRITTVSAATGMTSIETCLGPMDSIAAPADGRKCAPPEVERHPDQVIVNTVCDTSRGQERTSTLFTGDFRSWYRGIVKITYDPPAGGIATLGVTLDATRLGDECP
jgi:hypothetical protein